MQWLSRWPESSRAPLQLQVKVQGATVAVKIANAYIKPSAHSNTSPNQLLPLVLVLLHTQKVSMTVLWTTCHLSSDAPACSNSSQITASMVPPRTSCDMLVIRLLLLLLLLKVTHLLPLVPICYQSATNRSRFDVAQWNVTGGGVALWMEQN